MTAVIEDLDLSWVTFSGDDEPCDGWIEEDCPQEAVAVAHWVALCSHQPEQTRCCVEHRDLILAANQDPAREFVCEECSAEIFLARMEPIR